MALIDASALKIAISNGEYCRYCEEGELRGCADCCLYSFRDDNIEKLIDDQPTLDVQPVRHGHWNSWRRPSFRGFDEYGEPIYKDAIYHSCTRCGRRTVIRENYCPSCGAKMDEEG